MSPEEGPLLVQPGPRLTGYMRAALADEERDPQKVLEGLRRELDRYDAQIKKIEEGESR